MLTEQLQSLGVTDYEITTSSLEAGEIRIRFHIRSHGDAAAAIPPFDLESIPGYLWSTEDSESADGGRTITYVYKDAVGYLDAIPCVLDQSELLPLPGSGERLVSVESVLAACARSAAKAGVSLTYSGIGGYMAVFSGSSGSIWSTIREVIKWVPDVQSSCVGSSVRLFRGKGGQAVAATASIALDGLASGVLSVGSCRVDLGALYARYANRYDWERHRSVLVANDLVCCPEAAVAIDGASLRFTAREAGEAGNAIAFRFEVATTHMESGKWSTAKGTDNYNFVWCELSVVPIGRLKQWSIQCRDNANKAFTQEPRWLGVWEEMADGQGWTRLAVSSHSVAQAVGQPSVWGFDGSVVLSGRKVRLVLLDSPEADWQESSVFAARVSPVSAETMGTQLVEANGYRGEYVPQIEVVTEEEVPDAPPPMQPFSGGRDAGAPPEVEPIGYAYLVNRTVRTSLDNMPPPVVAARGRYRFEIPAGASIYQPGTFVYQIPYDSGEGGDNPDEGGGNSDAAAVIAANQEQSNPWSLVKGKKVPAGWQVAAAGEALDMRNEVQKKQEWLDFWASFASCRILKRISAGCLSLGTPVFEAVPGNEAFADDAELEEDSSAAPSSGKLESVYGEEDGVPANYKEDWTARDNLYVLWAGSFPAGARNADNVRQLRFCHGSLKQLVWVSRQYSGTASAKEAQEFFAGVMLDKDKKERHYICLKLDAVFINRRRTRYQQGTLRLAPDDPDYDASLDSGAADSDSADDTPLRLPDYYAALLEYYKATRALGQPEIEATLYGVTGYVPGETPLAAVFAALGAHYTAATVTWNAKDRTLAVSNKRKDILGVDDLLQRQSLGRQSTSIARQNRDMGQSPSQGDDDDGNGEDGEEGKEEAYPMVSASISVSKIIEAQAQRLEPFQIYTDDDGAHWINGGVLPSPAGLLRLEPTNIESAWAANREFFVRARWDASQRQYVAKVLYHSK